MKTHLGKWGNSLGLRIPRGVAEELRLHPDMTVEVKAAEGKLVVEPKHRQSTQLASLMRGITPAGYYGESWADGEVGAERVEWQ